MKADERHKLKSNQLADYAEQIGDWAKRHAKLLGAIAGVIILGAGLFWFLSWRHEVQKTNAWNEFAKVQKKASEPTGETAGLAEQFGRVAAQFPDTFPVNVTALYYQAYVLRNTGVADKTPKAEEIFRLLIDKDKKPYHPLITPLARIALADIDLSREQPAEAIEMLRSVETDTKADLATVAMARSMRVAIDKADRTVRER